MARRSLISYYLISALFLALYAWGFWGQARLAAFPDRAKPTSYPVWLDGVEAGSHAQLRLLAQAHPPGTQLDLRTADGTSTVLLPRARPAHYLVLMGVSALFFWSVGTLVFAPRSDLRTGRDFYWAVILYGLLVTTGDVYFPRPPVWESLTRSAMNLAGLFALPVLFVRLVINFPRPHLRFARNRPLIPLLWTLAVSGFFWQWMNYLAYFNDPNPLNGQSLLRPRAIADALLITQVVAGFAILSSTSRQLTSTREREQTKWLFWGFTVGVTPYVFLRSLPEMLGATPPLGEEVDRFFEMAIPTSFIFAVVKYRFLDIDIIIRRSIIYVVLAAGLIGLYSVAVLTLGQFLEGRPIHRLWILFLGLGIAAGVAFHPIRHWVGRAVDRVFFKIRYDPSDVVVQFRRELASVTTAKGLCVLLERTVEDSLGPRVHATLIRQGDEFLTSGNIAPRNARSCLDRILELGLPHDVTTAAPGSTGSSEAESDPFDAVFTREQVVLMRPIALESEIAGIILVGERQAERRYLASDLSMLDDLAELAAGTLERLRLSQAFIEESLATLRLHEVNRMKDEFLSQVAHDLRTPLASISWSTDNLLDGVAGDVSEPQANYLRSVRASAAHLNGMIRNLLELSRLEEEPETSRQPVALPEMLERARIILTPIADAQSQTIEIAVAPEAAVVLGNADKLLEVVINLVDNGLKYSPPEGVVRVEVPPPVDGVQALRVRDSGPGLGGIAADELFERYRQSAPSPHSARRGFGLGLHIAKTLLQHMDATIDAWNHEDGGAVFECRLTCEPSSESDA